MSSYIASGYWLDTYVISSDYLIQQYKDLVTSEHVSRPNFMAMVAATSQPFAEQTVLYQIIPFLYDVDIAVGNQLDIVGQWVGVSRNLQIPLAGVYFSLDTAGSGFDQGVWLGPFDPVTGLVKLPDEHYRIVIKARIINNSWNGSKEVADALLAYLFTSDSYYAFTQDNGNLSMFIGLAGSVTDSLSQVLLSQGFLDIKPAGVQATYMIPSSAGPIFGFDLENKYVGGFDVGSWGVSDLPYAQSSGYQLGINFILGQSVLL